MTLQEGWGAPLFLPLSCTVSMGFKRTWDTAPHPLRYIKTETQEKYRTMLRNKGSKQSILRSSGKWNGLSKASVLAQHMPPKSGFLNLTFVIKLPYKPSLIWINSSQLRRNLLLLSVIPLADVANFYNLTFQAWQWSILWLILRLPAKKSHKIYIKNIIKGTTSVKSTHREGGKCRTTINCQTHQAGNCLPEFHTWSLLANSWFDSSLLFPIQHFLSKLYRILTSVHWNKSYPQISKCHMIQKLYKW